jgi:hypothetical protein
MVEVITELEEKWGVTVVAFTSDASGESLKARKMVRAKFPHIVTPDCYAHQVSTVILVYDGLVLIPSTCRSIL